MRLNLNDNIRVKLTDFGKDIYYHQYDRLNNAFGRQICKPSMPKVDEDGYTTFQLWRFMELYGVRMGMTAPNVIKPLEIVFDAPTIEPERRSGRWMQKDLKWECDQCGCRIRRAKPFSGNMWNYYYCPNCGVKMEEGEAGGQTN